MDSEEHILLTTKVLEKIKLHAQEVHNSKKHEVMGYLMGVFQEEFVEVTEIIIPEQLSSPTGVRDKNSDVTLITALQRKDFQERNIVNVGWYHSHPGFGCFLSQTDLETQFIWQKVNPRMIALVIDNVSGDYKVFRVEKTKEILNSIPIPVKTCD